MIDGLLLFKRWFLSSYITVLFYDVQIDIYLYMLQWSYWYLIYSKTNQQVYISAKYHGE